VVADKEDFATLSKQIETLMQRLKKSSDSKTRRSLLAEMRNVIGGLDRQIVEEDDPDLLAK
jgi:hypothetical protein